MDYRWCHCYLTACLLSRFLTKSELYKWYISRKLKLSEITCRQNPCQERWISLFLTCINHHKILLQIYLQIRPHVSIVKVGQVKQISPHLTLFSIINLFKVFSSTFMKHLSLVSLSVNTIVPFLLHLVVLAVYKLLEPGKVYESNFTFSYMVYTAADRKNPETFVPE